MAAVRDAWEAEGWRVVGAAPSRAAAEAFEALSGIASQSLERWEEEWQAERSLLTRETIFMVDGSSMIGLKQLERLLASADTARAKAVLLADRDRQESMKARSAFGDLLSQPGVGGVS
jgi:ATP-dependent exoDNAse (exonuclease V) alpha subunit